MLMDTDPFSRARIIATSQILNLSIVILAFYLVLVYVFGPYLHKKMSKLRDLNAPPIEEVVHDISDEMGIKSPKILISESENVQCYVFGWTSGFCYITFTRGLLSSFTFQQIKPIIRHELSHIKNKDIPFMTWSKLSLRGITIWAAIYITANFLLIIFRGWVDLFIVTNFKEAVISELRFFFSETGVIIFLIVIVSHLIFFSASKQQELLADGRALLDLNDKNELIWPIKESLRIRLLNPKTTRKKITGFAFFNIKIPRRFSGLLSGDLSLSERITSIENSSMIYTDRNPYSLSVKDALFLGISSLYLGIGVGNVISTILTRLTTNVFYTSNYALEMLNNAAYLPITATITIFIVNLYSLRKSINHLNVVPKFFRNILISLLIYYAVYWILAISPFLLYLLINR